MKISTTLIALLLLASMSKNGFAQGANATNVVQPKIMVIPYIKESEDLRTVLEADFKKREVIAQIKNGFDNRGFTTKDFVATLKEAKDAKIFITNTQSDIKSALVEFSGADIYVEVEYNLVKTKNGGIAKIILNGYDASTGNAYANITCNSGERYGTDDGSLITAALITPPVSYGDKPSTVPCLDNFLDILQAKFTDMVNKGRSVKVDFSIDATAARDFDSKVGGKQLSDLIDDWLAENSYKNNYHAQGTTTKRLFYDDVRIPLLDANGRNFKLNKFGQNLTEYLDKQGVKAKRAIKNGGLFITISN